MTPEERLNRNEIQSEKHNEAIRDLILVSRTLLTSIEEMRETHREDHKAWSEDHKAWREAHANLDEKLNILIDTVDRIIRHKNDPPTA